jgi:RNA polymerase sigma factor (sigma-70 family)
MNNENRIRVPCAPRYIRKHAPWLTYRGTPLTIDELRFVSRNWPASTWERYLQTLEKQQAEFLTRWGGGIQFTSPDVMQDWLRSEYADDSPNSSRVTFDRKLELLPKAMGSLTMRESEVIHGVFFYDLTQRQVARLLNISEKRVSVLMRHALAKIKKELGT